MLTYRLLLRAAKEIIRLKNIGHYAYISRQSETAMFELTQIIDRIEKDRKDFTQVFNDALSLGELTLDDPITEIKITISNDGKKLI